jgi:ceramide synthetase
VDHLVWETRRKDHTAMVVHHGATLSLLVVSYAFGFLRVGAVIEVLHDACDVWMEAAKLCIYLRWHALAEALFVLFMASWVALRLGAFPLVIIRSTCLQAVAEFLPVYGPRPVTVTAWAIFNVLLLVLLGLHCYWFYFIVRIAVRTIKGNPGDVRSDDEADETDDLPGGSSPPPSPSPQHKRHKKAE